MIWDQKAGRIVAQRQHREYRVPEQQHLWSVTQPARKTWHGKMQMTPGLSCERLIVGGRGARRALHEGRSTMEVSIRTRKLLETEWRNAHHMVVLHGKSSRHMHKWQSKRSTSRRRGFHIRWRLIGLIAGAFPGPCRQGRSFEGCDAVEDRQISKLT